MSAAQDLDDFAVGAAITLDTRDMDDNAVAMHGDLGGIARDVDIAAQAFDGPVGDEEAVAIAMHIEAADGVFARGTRGYEMAGANFHQVPTLGQAIEGGIHIVAGCAARAKFADQLFECRAGVGELGDVVQERGVGHLPIIGRGADVPLLTRGARFPDAGPFCREMPTEIVGQTLHEN